jgi:hypothetical protein
LKILSWFWYNTFAALFCTEPALCCMCPSYHFLLSVCSVGKQEASCVHLWATKQ